MTEHKILFSGTTGAGKTTAIGSVSEIPPLSTDVRNTDTSLAKKMTTVRNYAFTARLVSSGLTSCGKFCRVAHWG